VIAILLVRPSGLFGKRIDDQSASFAQGIPVKPADDRLWGRMSGVLVWIAIGAVGFLLLPTARLQSVVALAAVYAIAVYSLSLLYHNAGMLSLANGGFMAVGAYTGALLAIHLNWGFWAALIPSTVFAGISGALIGLPASRAKGHHFLLLTFAFGSLIVELANNLTSITQGDQGLLITQVPGNIGPISFTSQTSAYYLDLAFVVLAAAVVYAIRRSPWGARLATIRDNENLARSLGLRVGAYKVLAFGLSAGMAGVAGLLYLYQQSIIAPSSFSVLATIPFVIMLILGGRSIYGPVVGVLVLSLIPEVINLGPQEKQLASGAVLILVVLLLPQGIVPSLRGTFTSSWPVLAAKLPGGRRRRVAASAIVALAPEDVASVSDEIGR
jgi:branched-chain amino acid transport system permease protein